MRIIWEHYLIHNQDSFLLKGLITKQYDINISKIPCSVGLRQNMTSISRSATFKFFCDFDITMFLPLEKLYHRQQYYHIISLSTIKLCMCNFSSEIFRLWKSNWEWLRKNQELTDREEQVMEGQGWWKWLPALHFRFSTRKCRWARRGGARWGEGHGATGWTGCWITSTSSSLAWYHGTLDMDMKTPSSSFFSGPFHFEAIPNMTWYHQ